MDPLGDADMVDRARAGDRGAMGQIVGRNQDAVVNYLVRLTGSRARAEEAAQETFVRFFQRIDRYDERGKLSWFLFRMGTNLVRSQERREKRRRILRRLFLHGGNGGPPQPEPAQFLIQQEAHRKIAEALTRLPLRYRAPLILHAVEDLPYREIAGALKLREGTVRSRIHRAREMLRESLNGYFKGGAS